MKPCEGLYADITKTDVELKPLEVEEFMNIAKNYENFKRNFLPDIDYPAKLSGTFEYK